MSINLGRRQFVKQDTQALVQSASVPRATFTAEKNRYTSFQAGSIYPIFWDEVLPGDHLKYEITPYIRLATPLFPNFSQQRVDIHVFYVPNRILWDNWTRFMGEQNDPSQSIDVQHPVVRLNNVALHTLAEKLGFPTLVAQNVDVNALPFRAYQTIWNQWYRDQDLQSSVAVSLADGLDSTTATDIRPRNKFHDYFTAARPWPQKFTAPTLPVQGSAPVRGIGFLPAAVGTASGANYVETDGLTDTYDYIRISNSQTIYFKADAATNAEPMIFADLSLATGISINQFRQSIMIQSLLERDARGGTRYVELLWNHFKVRNPDYRLQRPEYIGGGTAQLVMTPVAQTAPFTGGSIVGQLGGAATATGTAHASYAATEHGIIIGLISVRSELGYTKGLHRKWTRTSRYDYYWPSLHDLGEQAILNREIYMQGTATDLEVFGYQERWSEYRYWEPTDADGFMRPGVSGTLDAWHLIENFGSLPTLGDTFIREPVAPVQRMVAAGAGAANQQYIGDIYMRRTATRPLGMFSVPATLGRF